MNKRKNRIFHTLVLSVFLTLSMVLTAWANPAGEADDGLDGASRVITCGTGEEAFATDSVVVTGDAAKPQASGESPKQGKSLGMFTTTGYCNCSQCSGGHSLTYSGTVPQAGHTLSADLDLFPIGTRLMINGTIYTVEDMGSSVDGHKVDIYYASHEEAVAHGTKQEEVFMVE